MKNGRKRHHQNRQKSPSSCRPPRRRGTRLARRRGTRGCRCAAWLPSCGGNPQADRGELNKMSLILYNSSLCSIAVEVSGGKEKALCFRPQPNYTKSLFVQFGCYGAIRGCVAASDRVRGWVHYIAHPSAHTAAAKSAPRVPLCFRPCAFSAALNRGAESAHCRGESAPRVPPCFRPAAASAALYRAAAATACKARILFAIPKTSRRLPVPL